MEESKNRNGQCSSLDGAIQHLLVKQLGSNRRIFLSYDLIRFILTVIQQNIIEFKVNSSDISISLCLEIH